jgi:hypothetical protein
MKLKRIVCFQVLLFLLATFSVFAEPSQEVQDFMAKAIVDSYGNSASPACILYINSQMQASKNKKVDPQTVEMSKAVLEVLKKYTKNPKEGLIRSIDVHAKYCSNLVETSNQACTLKECYSMMEKSKQNYQELPGESIPVAYGLYIVALQDLLNENAGTNNPNN